MENFINVTPSALDFIKSSIEREKCIGVRVDVKSGGCSGMTYEIEFVYEPDSDDIVVKKDDVSIFISPKSAIFIANMTMDYVTTPMGSSIIFENPNAKSKCSCGKSFSVDDGVEPCSSGCCRK